MANLVYRVLLRYHGGNRLAWNLGTIVEGEQTAIGEGDVSLLARATWLRLHSSDDKNVWDFFLK
jgi:hypothetical protein